MNNKWSKVLFNLNSKIIPKTYTDILASNWMDDFRYRDAIIQKQGFVLLADDWIKPLANWIGARKCLEVMSGCGALAYSLINNGVNITATDNFTWNGRSNWRDTDNYWCHIENIDAVEAIRKYGSNVDIIIMSWPDYESDMAYRCLCTMREVNPNAMMIYIGEAPGGCTADDNFFHAIDIVDCHEFDEMSDLYHTWSYLHDQLYLIK